MTTDLLSSHRERLNGALKAIHDRGYHSAFPESPSPRVYGETAAADGKAAFEAHLGTTYALEIPGSRGTVVTEESPYGIAMDVSYPRVVEDGLDELLTAAQQGLRTGGGPGSTGGPGSRWRFSTGCTSGSSSSRTRSSTPAVRRS